MTIVNAESKLANMCVFFTKQILINKLSFFFFLFCDVNNFLINLEKMSYIVRGKVHRKFYTELA